MEALRSSQVDVIYPQVANAPELAALRGERGISVDSAPVLRFEQLSMRLRAPGHPALRKRQVRQALAYGIDRSALVRRLYRSINPNMRALESLVFMTNSPHYRPNWSGYRRRPAHARRLLEAAGCRAGADGIYVCDGERLSLRLATTAGNLVRERTAQFILAQLKTIGVEVRPVYATPDALFSSILPSGDFDLAVYGIFAAPQVGVAPETVRCGDALNNRTGYCSSRVTRDLVQGERALVPRKRAALLNRADQQLALDVPSNPALPAPELPRVPIDDPRGRRESVLRVLHVELGELVARPLGGG